LKNGAFLFPIAKTSTVDGIKQGVYLLERFFTLILTLPVRTWLLQQTRQAKKTPIKGDKPGYKTPHRKGYPLREEKREMENSIYLCDWLFLT
jgi:hypothetical protein